MKKGFTMVELLVVLLIVGILAAVAVPLYLANTQRAKASEAVATMGLIRQAERDYFVNHNEYFNVTTGNLTVLPPGGAGVDAGVAQYFSNNAFAVVVGGTSTRFTSPGPVDFVISVAGSNSISCNATIGSDCAVHGGEVSLYDLEMDNSGRIFVNYDNSTTWSAW